MAGGIIGGLAGQAAAAPDIGQAKSYANEGVQAYTGLDLGPSAGRAYNFNQEQEQGTLNPVLMQNVSTGPNAYDSIPTDAGIRNAQLSALSQLSQAGRTGLSPSDEAALNHIRNQNATDAQSKAAQLLQSYAAMGQAGSGTQLAAQLAASQNSAQNENQQSLQQAALASQNALNALAQSGSLGGQIRGQDYSEAGQRAAAQNAINQFNTQNQLGTQQYNVNAQNQAQAQNLGNKQNIANFNANLANQGQILQRQGEQQDFQRRLSQAQGTSGATGKAADMFGQMGANTAQAYSNMGAGVDKGAESILSSGGGAAAMFSDRDLKTDIVQLQNSIYRDVPTYSYRYKNPAHGQGYFIGTMAQDLLAVNPEHPAVIPSNEGLMVDYSKVE